MSDTASQDYLRIELAGHRLALPVAQIQEVLPAPQWRALPYAQACFLGLSNNHSEALPLLSLARLFELSADAQRQTPGAAIAMRELDVLLAVDAVGEIEQLRPSEATADEAFSAFGDCVSLRESVAGEQIHCLNPDAVLKRLRD